MQPSFEMLPRQEILHTWKQEPFQLMDGNQIFEGMRVGDESGGDLTTAYKRFRHTVLDSTFYDPGIVGIIGANGSGKGAAGMGMYRLLKADEYLHSRLTDRSADLTISVLPFALYQQASKLPEVRNKRGIFREYELYDPSYYAAVSQMMTEDVDEIIDRQNPQSKQAAIIEGSNITSFPASRSVPVMLAGIDRGHSPIYNAAVYPKTKAHSLVLAIERPIGSYGESVTESSYAMRKTMYDDLDSGTTIFTGPTRYIFTDEDQKEIDVANLPKPDQEDILVFLKGCMAPPHVIEKSNKEHEELKIGLGMDSDTPDRVFFTHMRKALGIKKKDGRFVHVVNPYLAGEKVFDIDYFRQSLPAKKYPQLVPDALKR